MSLASVLFAMSLAAPEAQATATAAQTPTAEIPAPALAVATETQRGVTSYPPSFFAEQRPARPWT